MYASMNTRATKIIMMIIVTFIAAGVISVIYISNHLDTASKSNTSAEVPCNGSPASKVNLQYPYGSYPIQEFTTTGGEIYVKVSNIEHGTLDRPTTTEVDFGAPGTRVRYDSDNKLANAIKSVNATQGKPVAVMLPEGRYSLWANAGQVEISSCQDGGVTL